MFRKYFPVFKICLVVMIFISGNSTISAQSLNHLYKAGEAGYACFRIPAMVVTNKGTVLAFAEARRNNCGDAGDIDLVVKRSMPMAEKPGVNYKWYGTTVPIPAETRHLL